MAQLPKRQLGKDGQMVSAIGFGAMGLSSAYGKVDSDEERFKVLDHAMEVGSTFWDSSDVCTMLISYSRIECSQTCRCGQRRLVRKVVEENRQEKRHISSD